MQNWHHLKILSCKLDCLSSRRCNFHESRTISPNSISWDNNSREMISHKFFSCKKKLRLHFFKVWKFLSLSFSMLFKKKLMSIGFEKKRENIQILSFLFSPKSTSFHKNLHWHKSMCPKTWKFSKFSTPQTISLHPYTPKPHLKPLNPKQQPFVFYMKIKKIQATFNSILNPWSPSLNL
jgi:hypothetical protein